MVHIFPCPQTAMGAKILKRCYISLYNCAICSTNHRPESNRIMSFFHHFLQIIRDYIFNRLETSRESYRRRIYNDLNKLYEYIWKGDC